jgi:hypothetical protein
MGEGNASRWQMSRGLRLELSSNAGGRGSNLDNGSVKLCMYVMFVCIYSVFVVLCVGAGLATG